MTISAKIILDSIAPHGARITTMEVVFPRFILAEFNTHRQFSRNASSSRAIPVAKMIEEVETNPALPIHWGKNQPGMQAFEELDEWHVNACKGYWLEAAETAANFARELSGKGLHKQVVNRILEPFQWTTMLVSSTDWRNFFELRDHPDAQPEIQELAKKMKEAIQTSKPQDLKVGEWHIPFLTEEEIIFLSPENKLKVSTARCARVSYKTHDGKLSTLDKDLELYERLITSKPIHASPAEHQAQACSVDSERYGNFRGWKQHRKLIEGF